MNGDDYSQRQDVRDAEYRAALDAWLQSAPRGTIEKLKTFGIAEVDPDTGLVRNRERIGRHEDETCREADAAEIFDNSIKSASSVDLAAAVDELPDLLAERFGLTPEQAQQITQWHVSSIQSEVKRETSLQLARIIGFYLQPGNVSIRTHALAHAARLAALSGITSLRHSARLLNVSVEAIRKVAWRWVELLGLPPLEGSKSQEARESYSEDKKTNHWRKQKCTKEKLPT